LAALHALGGVALAQSPLEDARERIDAAEFEQAVRVLDQLETGGVLTRDELVQLYLVRAEALLALGRSGAALDRDLDRLAALAPDLALSDRTRPELREGLAARRREQLSLSLSLEIEREAGAVRVRATVRGDPGGLVRGVRLHARAGAASEWTSRSGDTLVLPAAAGDVEYWGEAVGPGGAILATAGSASSPLRGDSAAAPPAIVVETPASPGGGDDATAIGVGIGIGAGVAVVIAIVLAVALTSSSTETQLGPVRLLP
jgi:hypothetical protein